MMLTQASSGVFAGDHKAEERMPPGISGVFTVNELP